MAAFYSYEYSASGFDAALASFVNFETTFTIPALTNPLRIPRGSVMSKAMDATEVWDGYKEVVLEQLGDPAGFTLFADLNTYVTAMHGSWTGEDAEAAIRMYGVSGSYAYYNCIAHLPVIGQDFEFNPMNSLYVSGLKLRYTLINTYTPT